MTTTAYPNLGFDPCPGLPESVSGLAGRVSTAADSMRRANELMNQLRNDRSGVWRGEAGDSFRSHLNSTLIDDLGKANQSLNKAVGTLQRWASQLGSYQQRARVLEQQAAQAQQRLDAATGQAQRAANDPDLRLAGQTFGDLAELHDARRRLDNATLALRRAHGEVDAAQDTLDHIRKQARDLSDEWDHSSNKAAGELRDAADFAPHKPGRLAQIGNDIAGAVCAVGDWVSDHLDEIHSALSAVSAVAGLVALCTPPPVDVIALGVSLVAGTGALATSLADPEIRGDLGEMLHGNFSGNWGSLVQLGGDAVGLVPGVGLAKGAATGGDIFAEGARGFPKIVDIASGVAHDPGLVMKTVERFVPQSREAVVGLGLLSEGSAQIKGATADMLNFLNKTRGAVQKTGGAVWESVSN